MGDARMNALARFKKPVQPAPSTEFKKQVVRGLTNSAFKPATCVDDKKAKPGRLIIGLDPSLTSFGYSEITESLEIVRVESIKTKDLRGFKRLDFLVEEVVNNRIMSKRTMWKEGIVVAREDYAYAEHSAADAVLKELGGILAYELHKRGVALEYIPIASIKKFATGKGNAPKEEMRLAVYKNFGVDTTDNDQADAFAVALAQVCKLNQPTILGLSKAQSETLTNMNKDSGTST
jgi:crossover junction endodeoxyribonuclease RuvC